MAVEPFELRNVRLLDSPCKIAQEANRKYLHELVSDRLLHSFRANAGLPAPGEPLGGWERPDCELRGHFVGHYLSACALMYASTGDEKLKEKAGAMVAELAKCQKALGGGYLSAFPESFWDRLESMDRVPWAPYYTIHKIMAGLFDMYSICGNKQALDVLKGMASYFAKRLDKLSGYQIDRMLTVEYGGMSEALHSLYSVTHDPAHLKLAHRFDWAAFLGPLALEHDNLSRIHGNTHIPIICGAARHYELTGDERYRTATRYFWDRIVGTRTYATGGTTLAEMWPEPNKLADTLGPNNQECCKTHNLLKVTRYLFRWTGDPKYADYYERAYFNGILGTQETGTGLPMYYIPLAAGFQKCFGTPHDSFWCCYGTGVESFAKLGDSIYFHDAAGIYVNLFVRSTVEWPEKGLRLEQVTRFPEEDITSLVAHTRGPVELALHIRVPYWATQGAEFKIGRKKLDIPIHPGSFAVVKRVWNDGDRLDVRLPMSLHSQPMPDDPEVMAFMYGPLVLAGIVRDEGEPNRAGSNQLEALLPPPTEGPPLFQGDPTRLDSWIKPVDGKPLTFRTVGQPEDITLVPLNRILYERYGVYWVVTKQGSPRYERLMAAEAERKTREARTIDRVIPGDAASEAAHNLKQEQAGSGLGYRQATDGGWFSWDLKVVHDVPVRLICTYWSGGGGGGPRAFDVTVNDRKIGTEDVSSHKLGQFFDVEYDLPADLVAGRDTITVKLAGHAANRTGRVYGCATLRAR